MPFSEWKIEICFFTLSCRIYPCLIIIYITNFKKPQKTVSTKFHESFQLSQNGIDIFSWVKMERWFSVRTVCSLVCELSQSDICRSYEGQLSLLIFSDWYLVRVAGYQENENCGGLKGLYLLILDLTWKSNNFEKRPSSSNQKSPSDDPS